MGPGDVSKIRPLIWNSLMIQMGDANGSIPTVQPVIGRPMWGYQPSSAILNSVVWVSQASLDNGKYTTLIRFSGIDLITPIGTIKSYGLGKRAEAVKNCRKITKKDMKHNDATPKMSGESSILHIPCRYEADSTVDPETYEVRADGVLCDAPPATTLPLTKKHFIF